MSYLLHFSPRRTHSPPPTALTFLDYLYSLADLLFICMCLWIHACTSGCVCVWVSLTLSFSSPSLQCQLLCTFFPGPPRYEGGKYPPTAHHSSRLFVYPLIIERSWRQYKVCACEGVFFFFFCERVCLAELSEAGWEGGCHRGNFTTVHRSLELNCRFFSSLSIGQKERLCVVCSWRELLSLHLHLKIMQQLKVIWDEYLTSEPC